MIINLPFTKTYRIKCPDGSIKMVYKNIDDAFPLFIPGWGGKMSADIKTLQEAAGKLSAEYASKVQGLLFSLDESNQSLMIDFRVAYISFQSDPCNNNGFFHKQIEMLLAQKSHLQNIKIKLSALIQVAKTINFDQQQFLNSFMNMANEIGGSSLKDSALMEIDETRKLAKEWADTDNES